MGTQQDGDRTPTLPGVAELWESTGRVHLFKPHLMSMGACWVRVFGAHPFCAWIFQGSKKETNHLMGPSFDTYPNVTTNYSIIINMLNSPPPPLNRDNSARWTSFYAPYLPSVWWCIFVLRGPVPICHKRGTPTRSQVHRKWRAQCHKEIP